MVRAWRIAYLSAKWWKVIDGTTGKPAGEPTDPDEKTTRDNSLSTYTGVDGQAHGGIVNSVQEHLLSTVIEATSAAAAWKTLKDRFDRETATSTISQVKSLLNLELSNEADLANHLTEFNNQWNRLGRRRSSTSESNLAKALNKLTQTDEAKAAFLHWSLPPSLDNVVDNLQTNLMNLMYNQIFAHLLDLNVVNKSNTADHKAYSSNHDGDSKGKN